MASVQDLLDRIDAKIYSIIDSPDDIASYRMGAKQVSKSQILEQLRKLREHLLSQIGQNDPYEDIRHFALDFDDIGEEEAEYIGDEV